MLQAATLIIGLGNPLRADDGVGVRAVEMLAQCSLPDDVEIVDGGTLGLGLVPLLEGRQRVILIDAADVGQAPGQFVRFMPEKVRMLGDDERIAIHEAELRDALLLAQALNMLPDQVVIFGVQPAKLDWDSSLSPEVEATLPSLIAAIQTELSDRRLRNKEEEGNHG